jgi:hypothetical protein
VDRTDRILVVVGIAAAVGVVVWYLNGANGLLQLVVAVVIGVVVQIFWSRVFGKKAE